MENTGSKNNGIFINHYPAGMVHFNRTTDRNGNEREFATVSFSCPESKNGYATFTVNLKQLLPSTKKDGTVVDGRYNILLGNPDGKRRVSIAANNAKKKEDRRYADVELTNQQVAKYVTTARNAYADAQEKEIS